MGHCREWWRERMATWTIYQTLWSDLIFQSCRLGGSDLKNSLCLPLLRLQFYVKCCLTWDQTREPILPIRRTTRAACPAVKPQPTFQSHRLCWGSPCSCLSVSGRCNQAWQQRARGKKDPFKVDTKYLCTLQSIPRLKKCPDASIVTPAQQNRNQIQFLVVPYKKKWITNKRNL